MRTDESCEKDKNQENYKRGNVSRLNILFVFLFFFLHREKSEVVESYFFLFRGDKRSLKKRLKKEKFSAIWTVHKSQCFNKKPRDRFLTKIELKVFPKTSDLLFNDCDGMMWSREREDVRAFSQWHFSSFIISHW